MRRRQLMIGAAGGLAALVGSRRVLAADRPAMLMLGSSSMGGPLGRMLERGFEALGFEVHRHHQAGSSLSRPDFFDWSAEGARLQEQIRPDAAIVMFSANDPQALYTGSEPKWIPFQRREAWKAAYRARVERLVESIAPTGQRVVWLGAPPMRKPDLSERMWKTNRIYEHVMAERAASLYIDTWPTLASDGGEYVQRLPIDGETRSVRAGDGVHISSAGARLIVDHAMPIATRFVT